MSYAYDPVGNRLSKTEDGSTTSYQYNAANQMLRAGDTTYAYDANGNRVKEIHLDGEVQYEYNANNFLVEYTSAEGRSTRYGYDGLNRRVYKAEGKNVYESYLYDGLDVLLGLAGPKGQHATTYYRANGRIVAQQKFSVAGNNGGYWHRPEGRRLYYTYDALGSIASLSNHKGKSKTRYVYDVFGEVLSGDLKENTYAFTGKRFDMESQTYHFHFRQYDAKVGVWTTPDPIGILGGLNVYSYVENNPVNRVDILGLHTGGYGGPGGDPEGNEMPDESVTGGTGQRSESERRYRIKIADTIFMTRLSDFFETIGQLFSSWAKELDEEQRYKRVELYRPYLKRKGGGAGAVLNLYKDYPTSKGDILTQGFQYMHEKNKCE